MIIENKNKGVFMTTKMKTSDADQAFLDQFSGEDQELKEMMNLNPDLSLPNGVLDTQNKASKRINEQRFESDVSSVIAEGERVERQKAKRRAKVAPSPQ